MSIFDSFPLMNAYSVNLDWILKKIRELEEYVRNYTAVNNVAYAGVWDITKQYPQWAFVTDGDASYLALQPVPVGIPIDNADYWQKLADLDPRISGIIVQLSKINSVAVNTVSDIKSLDADIGNMVFTSGFYTAGDGGGNAYVIRDNVTADNMGIFATAKPGLFAVSISDDNNIAKYGASTTSDNSDIIAYVVAKFGSAFVPKGVYPCSKTIYLYNNDLIGCSGAILDSTADIAIAAGRSSKVSNIELRGTGIGILGSNVYGLQRTSIDNIIFNGFETAIRDDPTGANSIFSVSFNNLEIIKCRNGIVLTSDYMTANTFNNVYITGNDEIEMEHGVYITGNASSMLFTECNVEHATFVNPPFQVNNCAALVIGCLHMEKCFYNAAYEGFIKFNRTSAKINALSIVMCNNNKHGITLIKLENSGLWEGGIDRNTDGSQITIDNLVVWGLNEQNGGLTRESDYYTIERPEKFNTPLYRVSIGNYQWFTFRNDSEFLKELDFLEYFFIEILQLPVASLSGATAPDYNNYIGKVFKENGVLKMFDGTSWVAI